MRTVPTTKFPTIPEVEEEFKREFSSTKLTRFSRSFRIAALILGLLFGCIGLALIFLPWVQTVQGYGRVIAFSPNDRQQNIEAPVEGQIMSWSVREGSKVRRGDVIVEIADIDPDFMERLQREKDAASAKSEAAKRSLEVSQRNLERQRQLFNKGLSSRRAVELAEIEEAKFLSEVASASAELARTETKIARQTSQKVLAPRDGVIQHVYAPSGRVFVKQGDLLALIVPDTDERAVEILIDGNDLPIISVDRPVRLQFEGWPAIQFSGWPDAAIGTFGGTVAVIDSSDNGMGKFRILIVPDHKNEWPDARFLRQGTRAVAWVTLDTVRLGWELWRRFNAFPITTSTSPLQLQAGSDKNNSKTVNK